jgi:hypothetical protein
VIARRICLVTGVVALAAAGCSTQPVSKPAKTVYVTRTPTPPASTGQSPAGGTAAEGGATGGTTATMRHLPGTCDDLLPAAAIDNALGRSLGGRTAFVVGLPEKDIGRIGYLNCRYGLPSANAAAKAEIGVSLYTSAARAAARIPATVGDYSNHGARSSSVTVKGHRASVLTGGRGTGYTEPTLVVAAGQRTVAVSVRESAGARARKDLSALAALALQQTGG